MTTRSGNCERSTVSRFGRWGIIPPERMISRTSRARSLRDLELLADALDGDAIGIAAGRAVNAFDGLQVRLAAECQSLVVHGEEELEASVAGHLPGLLGRAVVVNPRIVGAHRHDGES